MVPSSSLLLTSHWREGGPLPVLYLVCNPSMLLCERCTSSPPDSPRQLIQDCHVAFPSHNGVLSFKPHWHALIVMWIVEWWCPSTSFKGNEMSGWVAKVWLPVDGIHFILGGSVCSVLEGSANVSGQRSTIITLSYSGKNCNTPDLKVDTLSISIQWWNIICRFIKCECLLNQKWLLSCLSVVILLNLSHKTVRNM